LNEVLRARVRQGDLRDLPYADEEFHAALLNEVLEHVPDESASLTEIHRVLRIDGKLIVFSPNRWFPFEAHGVYLKRSGRFVPPYVPFIPYIPLPIGRRFFRYWARNYGHRELRNLVIDAGFQLEWTGFVWQTFENISGRQPWWISGSRGALRRIASLLERIPVLKMFGVSQVIVARKKSGPLNGAIRETSDPDD
jgi:SAM-dependent methyltransferase